MGNDIALLLAVLALVMVCIYSVLYDLRRLLKKMKINLQTIVNIYGSDFTPSSQEQEKEIELIEEDK